MFKKKVRASYWSVTGFLQKLEELGSCTGRALREDGRLDPLLPPAARSSPATVWCLCRVCSAPSARLVEWPERATRTSKARCASDRRSSEADLVHRTLTTGGRRWWTGMTLMAIGEIFNFVALVYVRTAGSVDGS